MAIQSCAPAAQGELAKGQETVVWAMYVGEHTSQAASAGSVCQRRTNPARSGLLSPLVGKGFSLGKPFFLIVSSFPADEYAARLTGEAKRAGRSEGSVLAR